MKPGAHVNLKTRKTLTLGNFKGVDYSSSPHHVSTSRATNMRNLINENGVNHKRKGWKTYQFHYSSIYANSPTRALHYFKDDKYTHWIIQQDGRLRSLRKGEAGVTETSFVNIANASGEKSESFMNNKDLYIVGCGELYIFGPTSDYKIQSVYGRYAYIPTTTISIDNDAVTSAEGDTAREVLESPNLLTPRRKNTMLGTSAPSATWTVDAGHFVPDTDVFVSVETIDETGVLCTRNFCNRKSSVLEDLYEISVAEDGTEVYSEEPCGRAAAETGKITLDFPTTPPLEGHDNIIVEFRVDDSGYSSVIDKCTFGVVFGADGASDRLFLSGNPDYPNMDFFSEPGDYTYFPEDNICSVGSSSSAITGYMRLNDGTLAIFKEKKLNEPTIFYRTGSTGYDYDDDGVISDVYGIFPSVAGELGETLITRHALANLGGDALMLSEHGVFGVVIGTNARTTERYTRERSRNINEQLKKHDLSKAVAIVHDNKYFLAVDGLVYIADSRHTYSTSDALDGSYNYEWWVWDNMPVSAWAIVDGELWFCSEDGSVHYFSENYYDEKMLITSSGELAFSSENYDEKGMSLVYAPSFEYDPTYQPAVNDAIYLGVPILVRIANNVIVEDSRIIVTDNEIEKIYQGQPVATVERGLASTRYIADMDREHRSFRLSYDEEGKDLEEIADGGFSLWMVWSDEVYVSEVDNGSLYLKTSLDGDTVYINSGILSTLILFCRIYRRTPVIAEWYTPLLDMGSDRVSKTLLSVSISTEPEINGRISWGYETRSVTSEIDAKGLTLFSFDPFDLENLGFDTAFATSYTKRMNVRNFNYIQFRFVSDTESDCAINNFSVQYKINGNNKGVR